MWIDGDAVLNVTRSNPSKLFTASEIERIVYRADAHGDCSNCDWATKDDTFTVNEFMCKRGRGCKSSLTMSFGFCDDWEEKSDE